MAINILGMTAVLTPRAPTTIPNLLNASLPIVVDSMVVVVSDELDDNLM